MAYKGVEYLETQKLLDAAKSLETCLDSYAAIMINMKMVTNDLIVHWHGEGCREFEKDYVTIYQSLTDISDIMYDLYDALVDSDATYVKTDEELAKKASIGE